MRANSRNIRYGQTDAQVNSNIHDHSIVFFVFIRNETLHITGIYSRLVMEKERMMVQGHVSNEHFEGII